MTEQVIHPLQKYSDQEVDWVCFDCADARGATMLPNHVFTAHENLCDICRMVKTVTEPRDFGKTRSKLTTKKKVFFLPVIDFDVLVYRVGFAGNELSLQDNLEYADNAVQNILDVIGSDVHIGYLTGKGNFRYKVGKILPYKGTRDPNKRPVFYKEIREHFEKHWGAISVDGIEADDAIGKSQNENTVICSVDKDFRTIEGLFYNLNSKKLEQISQRQAVENFYIQMLIGDKIDNIPGIKNPLKKHFASPPNFTESTAKDWFLTKIESGSNPRNLSFHDIKKSVEELYKLHYGEKSWKKAYKEVATLLYIQRDEAERFTNWKPLKSKKRYEKIDDSFGGSDVFDIS